MSNTTFRRNFTREERFPLETSRKQALLSSAQGLNGSVLMNTLPTDAARSMSNEEYRIALRLRTGLHPIASLPKDDYPVIRTVRNKEGIWTNVLGNSTNLATTPGKELIHQHDTLKNKQADLCRDAGLAPKAEVTDKSTDLRSDLEVCMEGRSYILETTTVALTDARAIAQTPGSQSPLVKAVAAKRTKYRETITKSGANLLVLAFMPTGEVSDDVRKFALTIENLCGETMRGFNPTWACKSVREYVFQTLGITALKANAKKVSDLYFNRSADLILSA
jgi:hypothetical protein